LIEVGKCVLCDLTARGAAEEEGGFRVFDGFGGFFVEGAFAACVAGFAVAISISELTREDQLGKPYIWRNILTFLWLRN